jgi:hypothetical protein
MHYVPHRMLREGFSVHAFRWPVVLWAGLGLIIGTAFGALGSEHKRGKHLPSLIGTASLVATFAGEAYVLYRTGHPRAVEVAVPIETATALIVPFVLLRSVRERAIAYVAASALVPIAVLGLSALMGVIHRVYPGID